jgi:uracil-DNA glycosylase family 4
MLSSRQQQCLQGIGVRLWRNRSTADAIPLADETVAAPANAEMIAATATQISELTTMSRPNIEGQAPAPDKAALESATRQAFEIPLLDNWEVITDTIHQCNACELSQNCTQKVPGIGDRKANLLIVGEGPGQDEDIRGEPFVGRSGQLLDRMLNTIGIAREQVYITNIVKCRPPNNRDPKADETQHCRVFLDAQIKQIAPKVILSVGRVSAHNLLGSNLPVGKLIQQIHQLPGTEIPVKVTYHPAYLLRSPAAKAIAWQDLKLLHRMLQ